MAGGERTRGAECLFTRLGERPRRNGRYASWAQPTLTRPASLYVDAAPSREEG